MTSLFKIENGALRRIQHGALSSEKLIEDWIEKDTKLIGLDLAIIGRQVQTDLGARIDILALDQEGNIVIIELKKNQTPRNVVAQILDYAAWVRTLKAPDIDSIARDKCQKSLEELYFDHFDTSVFPDSEKINTSHSMWIISSENDETTSRIIKYLSEEYGVAINTAFFKIHDDNGQQYLTTDYLLDQKEVKTRSKRRIGLPFSGFYYVNVSIEQSEAYWPDMRSYGYIAAGGSEVYTKPLGRLQVDDKFFAYQKGRGYVGYGRVISEKQLASDFKCQNGESLFSKNLQEPKIKHSRSNGDFYVVGVEWIETFDVSEAKTFLGIFANQNIVCALNDEDTLRFLRKEFGVDSD